jgi:hypothetical protein
MQALPSFSSLADDVNRNEKAFVDWVRSPRPEEHVPTFFRGAPTQFYLSFLVFNSSLCPISDTPTCSSTCSS